MSWGRLRVATGLCVAVALLALAVLPQAAGASTGARRFSLTTANGYRIVVDADDATVGLTVLRIGRSRSAAASTTYVARARPGAGGIEASLGTLGDISMRFKPTGRVLRGKARRNCKGPDRMTVRFGLFVGTLRFQGEGGYVSIRVHRAKGREVTPPSPRCAEATPPPVRGGHAPPRTKTTSLNADFRLGLSAVYFKASTDRAHRARYSAYAEEVKGQVAISHYAEASASPRSFASDDALSFASITPPPPFSGTGSLQRNTDGSKVWSGSLALSFPGAPDVPLTGPQFKTRLTRSF